MPFSYRKTEITSHVEIGAIYGLALSICYVFYNIDLDLALPTGH